MGAFISLDCTQEAEHDRLRGRAGLFCNAYLYEKDPARFLINCVVKGRKFR